MPLLYSAMFILIMSSCKKVETISPVVDTKLEHDNSFRKYVANDLFAKVRYTIGLTQVMNKADYNDFKNKLKQAKETELPSLFKSHHLDYTVFQRLIIGTVVRRAQAIKDQISLNNLSEIEVDRFFNDAYQKVADEILEQAKEKSSAINSGSKIINRIGRSQNNADQALIKSTNMILEEPVYQSFPDDYENYLSEETMVDLISVELDKVSGDGLTASEAWGCFKSAMGFGGLTMAGIAGWARASAGLQIQEFVSFATGWALKHIGWIGAAVAVVDFSVCIYNSI